MNAYLRLLNKSGLSDEQDFSFIDTIFKRISFGEETRVLDISQDVLHRVAYIAKNYDCLATGLDGFSHAKAHAHGLYKNELFYKKMSFLEGTITKLPFANNFFHLVLVDFSLFFERDKERVLKEITRVVKPGGYVAVNELCLSEENEAIKEYLMKPPLEGFIDSSKDIIYHFKNGWYFTVKNEQPFDGYNYIKYKLAHLLKPKGALQVLELTHLVFVDQEARKDLFALAQFLLNTPKKTADSLNKLILLVRKKA